MCLDDIFPIFWTHPVLCAFKPWWRAYCSVSLSPLSLTFFICARWGFRTISSFERVKAFGLHVFQLHTVQRLKGVGKEGATETEGGGVCLLVCECPLREPVQVKQEVFVLIWRLWLAVIQTAQGLTWAIEGRAWLRSREEQKVQQRIAECEIRCGASDKSCLAQDVGEKKRSGEKKGRSGCVIGAGCDFWKDLTWLAWVLASGLRSFIVCVRKIETDRQSLSHCQAIMTVMIVFYCPLNP